MDHDSLRKAAQKATPGPWTVEPHGNTTALYSGRDQMRHGLRLLNLDDGDWNFGNNRDFIALANPATILALLDERDALEERLKETEWRLIEAEANDMVSSELLATATEQRDALEKRVEKLEAALRETLEIASRNEWGDYIGRATDALSNE